jgi:hypothetical protein
MVQTDLLFSLVLFLLIWMALLETRVFTRGRTDRRGARHA